MGDAEAGKASSLIGQLTVLAGLAAGAVTIVYGAGAVVYWAALSNRDVPSNLAIATSLPREFLIGTGLLYVALPIALTALVLFALTPILVKAGNGGAFFLGMALSISCGGLVWAVKPESDLEVAIAMLGLFFTVGILTWLLIILVTERSAFDTRDRQHELREKQLRDLSGKRELEVKEREELERLEMQRLAKAESRPAQRQLRTYLVGIGLVAITAWGILIGIARTDLPPAKLCTTDGGAYTGFLIGETGARVYVGETPSAEESTGDAKAEPRPNQIISVPIAEVAKLFIGSDRAACKLPSTPEEGKAGKS